MFFGSVFGHKEAGLRVVVGHRELHQVHSSPHII